MDSSSRFSNPGLVGAAREEPFGGVDTACSLDIGPFGCPGSGEEFVWTPFDGVGLGCVLVAGRFSTNHPVTSAARPTTTTIECFFTSAWPVNRYRHYRERLLTGEQSGGSLSSLVQDRSEWDKLVFLTRHRE